MIIKYKGPTAGENRDQSEGMIGPHQGIELELMLAGSKPLAMFNDDHPYEWVHPTEFFQPFVEEGQFIRRNETYLNLPIHHLTGTPFYHYYFALPEETWRIKEMHQLNIQFFVNKIRPTAAMERRVGELLGYRDADIDLYLERNKKKF